MKVLIVWAHPERNSFTHEMVKVAQQSLESDGHEVRVTDLYRSNFNPVASEGDFTRRVDNEKLLYDAEQLAASQNDSLNDDLQRDLDDLVWCDLLILQFPLWWFSVPAIMKGWIDRLMVKGVAYGGGNWYDRGGFAGKRAILSITTAAYEQMCSPRGINGDMDVILWPLQQGTLRFVGFDALRPNIFWSAAYSDSAAHKAALHAWQERLKNIADEPAEPCHGRADFGKNWKLLDDVKLKTVGHWL